MIQVLSRAVEAPSRCPRMGARLAAHRLAKQALNNSSKPIRQESTNFKRSSFGTPSRGSKSNFLAKFILLQAGKHHMLEVYCTGLPPCRLPCRTFRNGRHRDLVITNSC